MYFYDVQSRETKQLLPGIVARTFWGEQMLCAVVELEANTVLPWHSHPHEQAGMVLEGELALTVGEEERLLRPGDLYISPGGVQHTARTGAEPARVLDIFSPVREEYKY
jgi:quercetin dioxygenase-like cupin family protein